MKYLGHKKIQKKSGMVDEGRPDKKVTLAVRELRIIVTEDGYSVDRECCHLFSYSKRN